MKKNKFVTILFISCVPLFTGLLLGDQAFATSAEITPQEKIIAESSQKLTQLKETKQTFSQQQTKKRNQLLDIQKKMQEIQTELAQLNEIKSTGIIYEVSKPDNSDRSTLTTHFSPITIKDNATTEKKGQLAYLKQEQATLKLDSENISKQELEVHKQETLLSEKIAQAKSQKVEQAKQTDIRSAVVDAAKTHLGKPYVYGAAGPDAFDCSGLVQVAFASAGHALGRTTVDQETAGETIPVSQAQAGDLVFWGSHGGTYHVGISTGDGSYIHAPVPGDVVQIATVASYTPDFAVRVL
ncbi:C40 family peptidase [Enterococcus caccae]|uniref:NlpC/P60 domain-containing protein n=1 Tax=Enterococcus caccae ATCC BAA-1240 TaxID=1158612 RepID=R3TZR7_9ENTE|nr:C40 family peptidase [Enterococcus caccae]EOL47099.1 hypothetical protein UC7_01196 [Enterococcus caccae ATCC BAA-1240]EOT65741.1 hypothetical protein I580_01499 [Enterococcus caccae ATCC BAA-1240]